MASSLAVTASSSTPSLQEIFWSAAEEPEALARADRECSAQQDESSESADGHDKCSPGENEGAGGGSIDNCIDNCGSSGTSTSSSSGGRDKTECAIFDLVACTDSSDITNEKRECFSQAPQRSEDNNQQEDDCGEISSTGSTGSTGSSIDARDGDSSGSDGVGGSNTIKAESRLEHPHEPHVVPVSSASRPRSPPSSSAPQAPQQHPQQQEPPSPMSPSPSPNDETRTLGRARTQAALESAEAREVARLRRENQALAQKLQDLGAQYARQVRALQVQLQQLAAAHEQVAKDAAREAQELRRAHAAAVDDARRAHAQVQVLEERVAQLSSSLSTSELVSPDERVGGAGVSAGADVETGTSAGVRDSTGIVSGINSSANFDSTSGTTRDSATREAPLAASAANATSSSHINSNAASTPPVHPLRLTQQPPQNIPASHQLVHSVQRSVVGSPRTDAPHVTCHAPSAPSGAFTVRATRLGRSASAAPPSSAARESQLSPSLPSPAAASGATSLPPPAASPFFWDAGAGGSGDIRMGGYRSAYSTSHPTPSSAPTLTTQTLPAPPQANAHASVMQQQYQQYQQPPPPTPTRYQQPSPARYQQLHSQPSPSASRYQQLHAQPSPSPSRYQQLHWQYEQQQQSFLAQQQQQLSSPARYMPHASAPLPNAQTPASSVSICFVPDDRSRDGTSSPSPSARSLSEAPKTSGGLFAYCSELLSSSRSSGSASAVAPAGISAASPPPAPAKTTPQRWQLFRGSTSTSATTTSVPSDDVEQGYSSSPDQTPLAAATALRSPPRVPGRSSALPTHAFRPSL